MARQKSSKSAAPPAGPMLSSPETAKYLGVADVTLEKWRKQGVGPAYCKISHTAVRYRRDDLDDYLVSCRVSTAWQA